MKVRRRVVLASMVVAACAGREGRRAPDEHTTTDTLLDREDSAAAEQTLSRHDEALRDMTGDGRPERFIVTAEGPRYDSLTVRLDIRSSENALLYSATWPSASYLKYEDRAQLTDADVARTVRTHLDRLLADSAFGVGPRIGAGVDGRPADDLDAIRFDLAEERWRQSKNVPLGAPLPPGWWEGVHAVAGQIPASRIRTLAAELRSRPSFKYYAGGEETYVIAWSAKEQRFVRIFACC